MKKAIVKAKVCSHCGHHEIGITSGGVYRALKTDEVIFLEED